MLRLVWWAMLLAAAFLAGMVFESFSGEIGRLPTRAEFRSMLSLNQVVFEKSAGGGLKAICFCSISVSSSVIPKSVKQAVIAIEDRRFYFHPGLDPVGIVRAIKTNIKTEKLIQGGSTLTQQLVKNVLLSPKKSFGRKGLETLLALYVELNFTKDEILTAYLNRMEFGRVAGRPVVGVEQASLVFFGKHVWELSLYESAVLAGVLSELQCECPRG